MSAYVRAGHYAPVCPVPVFNQRLLTQDWRLRNKVIAHRPYILRRLARYGPQLIIDGDVGAGYDAPTCPIPMENECVSATALRIVTADRPGVVMAKCGNA